MASTLLRAFVLLGACTILSAFSDLSRDQTKLLKDPGGWDYLKMSDNGIQTEHPCFDGKPHPDECSGRLTLGMDNKFTQEVTIHGQAVPRHGTYKLEDDQLTFFDELETRDGPYTIEIDAQAKTLLMYTSSVRIELTLHKALLNKKRRETK